MRILRRGLILFAVLAGTILLLSEGMPIVSALERPGFSEVDGVTVAIVTDNYMDLFQPDSAVCKRYRGRSGKSLHAEHGLAYYIQTNSAGRQETFMFDFADDPRAVQRNMELLGISLEKISGIGLSHDHWDHWGAMVGILNANREKIPEGTPLYVGQEAFSERFFVNAQGVRVSMGKLDRSAVESIGKIKVVEVVKPTQIMKGGYSTGYIERITGYEKIPPAFLIKRGEKIEADQITGEQALFFNVKGKGLVILSGCAHRGIINTVKHIQKITGIRKVHAVIGGFHLAGVSPENIRKTVADMKAIEPEIVVPTHCTGFEAISVFRNEMPKQFILNTAGAKYTF